MTTPDEDLAIQRGHARFVADVTQTVRVIAERYRATGAALTGDAAAAILDEALADVGLASRWPAEQLAALADDLERPGGASLLSMDDTHRATPLLKPLFDVFGEPAPA